jgi:hypothetical protein
MRLRFVFSLCACLSIVSPALGQTDNASPGQNCQANPAPGETDGQASGQQPLSDKLGDCKGVLKPPPAGDREMATPPPTNDGKTPVIRPGDVPEQNEGK